jgi:hypothetical protein
MASTLLARISGALQSAEVRARNDVVTATQARLENLGQRYIGAKQGIITAAGDRGFSIAPPYDSFAHALKASQVRYYLRSHVVKRQLQDPVQARRLLTTYVNQTLGASPQQVGQAMNAVWHSSQFSVRAQLALDTGASIAAVTAGIGGAIGVIIGVCIGAGSAAGPIGSLCGAVVGILIGVAVAIYPQPRFDFRGAWQEIVAGMTPIERYLCYANIRAYSNNARQLDGAAPLPPWIYNDQVNVNVWGSNTILVEWQVEDLWALESFPTHPDVLAPVTLLDVPGSLLPGPGNAFVADDPLASSSPFVAPAFVAIGATHINRRVAITTDTDPTPSGGDVIMDHDTASIAFGGWILRRLDDVSLYALAVLCGQGQDDDEIGVTGIARTVTSTGFDIVEIDPTRAATQQWLAHWIRAHHKIHCKLVRQECVRRGWADFDSLAWNPALDALVVADANRLLAVAQSGGSNGGGGG